MKTARGPAETTQATARPVLSIHIDLEQLIAVVRRHGPLSPMTARAIRSDWVRLFDTTRVIVVSRAPTRNTHATTERSTNIASKRMQ